MRNAKSTSLGNNRPKFHVFLLLALCKISSSFFKKISQLELVAEKASQVMLADVIGSVLEIFGIEIVGG